MYSFLSERQKYRPRQRVGDSVFFARLGINLVSNSVRKYPGCTAMVHTNNIKIKSYNQPNFSGVKRENDRFGFFRFVFWQLKKRLIVDQNDIIRNQVTETGRALDAILNYYFPFGHDSDRLVRGMSLLGNNDNCSRRKKNRVLTTRTYCKYSVYN